MKKKPKLKENCDFMKTNKDNIKNIVRQNDILGIVNSLAINTNKIVIHAYHFLKLYILYLYENNKEFPVINKEFIMNIFKVLTIRKCGSGGYTEDNMPSLLKDLTKFYNEHYKNTRTENDILYYDKMSCILAYEAIDMIKNIENNIRENFICHVNKFINLTFSIKKQINKLNIDTKDKDIRKQLKKDIYKEIQLVKNDLANVSNTELLSNEKYHQWIQEQKKYVIPNKTTFNKNNINYDLKSNTMDYLKPMIYIGIQLEHIYNSNIDKLNNNENTKQIRLFNILPLRTNIIPKNITLDTAGLVQNFSENNKMRCEDSKKYKENNKQYELWNRHFNLNKKVFKKHKYEFNHMIKTNGVSVSILFAKLNNQIKTLKKKENSGYIETVKWTDELKKKKIICADPGHSDLIYCGSKDENNNLQTFRYTQNQRRLETRTKKYSKIIDKDAKTSFIDNKSIKQIETDLSDYNSKTDKYDKFLQYIKEKNKTNDLLFTHYEKYMYRKFKLNRFINTQKSESKMIKNFSNKFGKSENTIFVIGDYDKGEYNMKGLESTICKKFRKIFRDVGYETFLINEYHTSKLCNECHNELEKFMYHDSKKPKQKGNSCLVNGLLRCTTVKPQCEIIHNRDKNAVMNMLHIIEELKLTGKRPKKYTRETSFPLHGDCYENITIHK